MRLFFPLLFIVLAPLALAHTEKLEVIEVTHGKDESSLSSFIPTASVMKEKELLKRRESTLGDTLRSEVGIQSTSFGPSSGRPIIRGLDGNRIRILQNGLGTLDASSQSLDHAIPIDTLTIDKVEIVRGPMNLLYGSSAVGGVVNIVNNRIHREYSEGLVTQFDARGETVNNSLSLSNRIDYGINKWMLHFDGSLQNAGDQEIPGHSRSPKARDISTQTPEPRDKLPNSFSQQHSFAVGASRIYDQGHFGFSYYRFDNDYGSIAEPDVMIRMAQNRVEFASEHRFISGVIRQIRFRSAQSFYKHEEFEGDEVGTTFRNSGNESRLEFHSSWGEFQGVSGIHSQWSKFRALGEEAFLPESDNLSLALFSLQKLALSEKNSLEFGGRLESNSVEKNPSTDFGKGDQQQFTGLNASLGYQRKLGQDVSLNTSYSYTERAPTFQELYSEGAHLATGLYERGNKNLTKEKANAFELSLKKNAPSSTLTLSTYLQSFKDFISLNPTGTTDADSGFDINAYRQQNAVIYGAEADLRQELKHNALGGSWWGITKADVTRGKGKGGDNLPRMPAPRLTLGLEFQKDRWEFDVEAQHYFEQTHTAPGELRTDAFTMLNLGVIYELPRQEQNFRFYFRVKNITDEEGRLATSTIKDRAPLPGRNFLAGVQALF